jgi:hypothetical protein
LTIDPDTKGRRRGRNFVNCSEKGSGTTSHITQRVLRTIGS